MARSTKTEEAETEEKEEGSLYDAIVEATDISFDKDDFEDHDEYKAAIATHFSEMDESDYNDLDKAVSDYANDLIETIKKNKSSRRKTALPHLDGLDEEEVQEKKGRGKGKATKEKVKKESTPRDNRYLKAARALLDNPDMSREDLAKKCGFADNAATYCLQAFVAHKQAFEEKGWKAP